MFIGIDRHHSFDCCPELQVAQVESSRFYPVRLYSAIKSKAGAYVGGSLKGTSRGSDQIIMLHLGSTKARIVSVNRDRIIIFSFRILRE